MLFTVPRWNFSTALLPIIFIYFLEGCFLQFKRLLFADTLGTRRNWLCSWITTVPWRQSHLILIWLRFLWKPSIPCNGCPTCLTSTLQSCPGGMSRTSRIWWVSHRQIEDDMIWSSLWIKSLQYGIDYHGRWYFWRYFRVENCPLTPFRWMMFLNR